MESEVKGKDEKAPKEEKTDQVVEPKKRFVSINDLKSKELKITDIFKKSKKKLEESKPSLFLRPHNYQFQSMEYKPLFQYESTFPLKTKQEFPFIYDCLNFICYQPNDEENSKNPEKYTEKIKNIFSTVKEKGTLLLLIDEFHIENFFPNLISALGNDYKTKLFINFYFLDTRAFLFLVSIQKMAVSDTPIVVKDTKILITDFFSQSKLLGSSTLGKMKEYLEEPLLKMRRYRLQCEINFSRIKTLHPGEFYEMRFKSSPLNKDISYIITIHDTPVPAYQKTKQCFAVSISYDITQEIIFSKQLYLNKMCQHLKAARLIAIESSILNPSNYKDITIDLAQEIQLMKPEGFTDEIQMRLWEDHSEKNIILEKDKYLISDFDEKRNLRQLYVFYNNIYILREQIQTKLTSKSKISNPPKGVVYYPIETQEKYKSKGVVQCVDDHIFTAFYEQSILCTVFYLDLSNFPRNTIKVMDIGAGIGALSFYFNKLFKGNCEIDNIEKNKTLYEFGLKYFGFQNYDDSNRVRWFFEEPRQIIDKMANFDENKAKTKKSNENKFGNKLEYYDLIFNQLKEINPKDDSLPSKEYFDDNYLTNIKKLLRPFGIYTVNLMCKNFYVMNECFKQLEKHFPSIYLIPSEGGLCNIFFCFRDKVEINEYQQKYKDNKEIIEKNTVIDYSVVEMFIKNVLSKVQDIDEQKKIMEENAKKY